MLIAHCLIICHTGSRAWAGFPSEKSETPTTRTCTKRARSSYTTQHGSANKIGSACGSHTLWPVPPPMHSMLVNVRDELDWSFDWNTPTKDLDIFIMWVGPLEYLMNSAGGIRKSVLDFRFAMYVSVLIYWVVILGVVLISSGFQFFLF